MPVRVALDELTTIPLERKGVERRRESGFRPFRAMEKISGSRERKSFKKSQVEETTSIFVWGELCQVCPICLKIYRKERITFIVARKEPNRT